MQGDPIEQLLDQLIAVLTDPKYLKLIEATAATNCHFYKSLIAGGMPIETAHSIVTQWNPMGAIGGNQKNA